MLKTYDNYQEFRKAVNNLFSNGRFNQIIELATRHQTKFLSLAHIILANAYIQRAVYRQETPNKADFVQSFVHIQLALKCSPDSVDLFLQNGVKFSAQDANNFMVKNVNQYQVVFSEEEVRYIQDTANAIYEERAGTKENVTCNM